MGKLISRFDKSKPLQLEDLITSGIACQLLYTHPKTLNEWVDNGNLPAIKANQRTRWDKDSSSWRVFKVSHLLTYASLRRFPVDETMLCKNEDPMKLIHSRYHKVLCYGYHLPQDMPKGFERVDIRDVFRGLELCPILPILIGPDINVGQAIGFAEELTLAFDPLDITIWRHMDVDALEYENINDFDFSIFKEKFDSLVSAYDYFTNSREKSNAPGS